MSLIQDALKRQQQENQSGAPNAAPPPLPSDAQADAREKLKGFENRRGWAELPAVKNGQLYGVYQGASRTISDFAMVQYMAKQLYPAQFKDMDPLANYLNFYKKYLPVTPQGTFVVGLKD